MILILAQLALLLLTAWGWGFWLWTISRAKWLPGWKRYGWFFFGVAGYIACVLFLLALVYFNLPLKWSSWIALLIAIVGAAVSLLPWPLGPHEWHHYGQREIVAAGLLFAAVFAFQSGPLFHAGPENYYGNAHTDQVNYVLIAEFLVEKPYSTSVADVGFQPWLARPISLKDMRIGECVANGYLAVITLTDAKSAYGTLSIFMVGMGAVAVFVLSRMLSVPRVLAASAGLWWGVLPAVTKIHLDGFLSQTCVLFVFPTMAAVFYLRRGKLERTTLFLMTLYLAYLLCNYAEVYILCVGLVVSLIIFSARQGTPLKLRVAAVLIILLGSALLCGRYAFIFLEYLAGQYKSAGNASMLAVLAPMSGTWVGWKQIFFGYETFADAKLERLSVFVGLALIFVGCCAFQGRALPKRRFLLALIAPSLGVLAVLLSAPELPKYVFSKLVDTYTTFWIVLAAVGLLHVGSFLTRVRVLHRILAWAITGALVLLAFHGSWSEWVAVCEDQGLIAAVDSTDARHCYAAAQKNPSAVYLVDEPHNLLCAWLAYAARHSKVYVDADLITDLPVPPTIYAFRQIPPSSDKMVVLDAKGPRPLAGHRGPPDLIVRNPQGVEGIGNDRWYWIGSEITLELVDYSTTGNSVRRFALAFDAMAGPANPSPSRQLVLIGPDGSEQKIDFVNNTSVRFEVSAGLGKTLYRLKVAYPTEQTVKLPSDSRDLMVRVQRFVLVDLPDTEHEVSGGPKAATN